MFNNSFSGRVKNLARRADLKIADLKPGSAQLIFDVKGHTQHLFIIDYDGMWEFSCPSIVSVDDISDIPHLVLAFALEQNSTNKRGFWCIETIGGKKVLEYMHNIAGNLLTPQEFGTICWSIVTSVEAMEEAFRQLANELLR